MLNRSHLVLLTVGAGLSLAGCGGGSTAPADTGTAPSGAAPVDSVVGGSAFVDPHQGGQAAEARLVEATWGRLVDVYDLDPATGERALVYADLVVGSSVASDGVDYLLDRREITQREELTILHAEGTLAWGDALRRAMASVEAVEPAQSRLPVSAVPRDAVVSLRFDDLVDPALVGFGTVRAYAGSAGQVPFDVRVLPDPNHGDHVDVDGDGVAEFLTTRVLVDAAVSALEAVESTPGGAVNVLGWPASTGPVGATARIETTGAAGLAVESLAFRTGGPTVATGDANNGYLASSAQPMLLGVQDVTLIRAQAQPGGDFKVAWKLDTKECLARISEGDVIQLIGVIAEVVDASSAVYKPNKGIVGNVRVQVVAGSASDVVLGPGRFLSAFEVGPDIPGCFVRFSPEPTAPPTDGVGNDASATIRFTQPMDPTTLEALGNFTVTRLSAATGFEERVVGRVVPSVGLDEATFVPSVPFDHASGTSTTYRVSVLAGPNGPRSLSGAELADGLPPTEFTIDATEPTVVSGGIALSFESLDQNADGLVDLRGQFNPELGAGRILSRPVSRFSAVVDSSQPMFAAMIPLASGVQGPLNPLGSRMQTVWRYTEMGLSLFDESTYNIDVEGLAWSPAAGAVVADSFQNFEMSLAHAGYLPDEEVGSILLPLWPDSGLRNVFADNQLDPVDDPLTVVHPRPKGYDLSPADAFVASTGTVMMPWPLNQGAPASDFEYWTWRDTAVQAEGAPNGTGADPGRLAQVTGTGATGFYPAGEVPSIGMPLLMEFRTYPDNGAVGLNALAISIAANSSALPAFRIHSSGGFTAAGNPVVVDPDLQTVAQGGFSATGQPTPPADNAVHRGQADFVVRVSRAHSIWFDTLSAGATFGSAVVEPASQPAGTELVVEFRGATAISGAQSAWQDGANLDAYGEPLAAPFTVTYLNGDASWKSSLSALNGARYVQARVTFTANAESGELPAAGGIGLPFLR